MILVFLFLMMTSGLVHAQKSSLSGFVTDKENGETLILANVVLEGTNIGAATNSSGYYVISNIPPGIYTVYSSYLGFEPFRKEINISSGQSIKLDIALEPESSVMDEVIVTSERAKEDVKNIGIATVNTQLIKSLPAVFEADVFRSVQLLPGVKSSNDFSSGLYIRGGGPDQTLILLDRTSVYNPSHFFGFFSTFNPDAIKDVRLYKGGYPAQYGGRLGAVLDIYNKDGNRNKTQSTATVGMLASRVATEGPIKNGSYMLAFRRSTIDPILSVLSQNNENIPTMFYFFDINAKLNYDINASNKISLASYGGRDRVDFPFSDDAEFNIGYGNSTVSGNWLHIFSPQLFSNFTFTWSRYFNQPSANFGGTSFNRDNNVWDASVKGDLQYIPNQRHELEFGFWAGNLTLQIEDFFDGQQVLDSYNQSAYASVYVQESFTPSVRWKFQGGLRANWFDQGDYIRLEPRFNAEYKATSKIRIQAAYGRYYQFLTLITNDSVSAFDIWLITDDGVRPSWGDQFVAGIKTNDLIGKGFNLDVEVYYRNMQDLFELDPRISDVAGLEYAELFRFGDGYAYGTEVFLEKTMGKFTGFVGYTFSITRRRFPGFNIPIAISEGNARFYPPRFDRRNDVNAVVNYDLSKKWRATVAFTYATGQAYTEPRGQYVIQNNPTGGSPLWVLVPEKLNGSRLPAYHRMDIGFKRLGKLFKRYDSEFQFQIINVYNRKNVWFYDWSFEDNTASKSAVVQLPLLPNLSYTVNF